MTQNIHKLLNPLLKVKLILLEVFGKFSLTVELLSSVFPVPNGV